MRKIISALVIAVVLGVSVTACTTLDEKLEYVYSLIQEEYGIELTENNVVNATYEDKSSRDFACVVSIELSDEYAHSLEEYIRNDASWLLACKAKETIDKYAEPLLSSFENLSALKNCCMEDDSYIKLIVYEEALPYVKEFSILVVNTSNAELFYFLVK